jgi:protein gp37
MAETTIEWADYTFNPWEGCSKISPECENCYAAIRAHRLKTVKWGPEGTRRITKDWKKPRRWNQIAKLAAEMWEAVKDDPKYQGKVTYTGPLRVFCASLADVFEDRPEVEAARVRLFHLISETRNLEWLLLTKRPENIRRFHGSAGVARSWPENFPGNVRLGVSCGNRKNGLPRVEILRGIPGVSRFLSCEPLLEDLGEINLQGINWVIAGGESQAGARPSHPQWFRNLRDQCAAAGVPFLFKQWGEWMPFSEMADGDEFYRSRRLAKEGENQHTLDDVYGRDCTVPTLQLQFDAQRGYQSIDGQHTMQMFRAGKKAAGRLLDGIEWNQFPEAL